MIATLLLLSGPALAASAQAIGDKLQAAGIAAAEAHGDRVRDGIQAGMRETANTLAAQLGVSVDKILDKAGGIHTDWIKQSVAWREMATTRLDLLWHLLLGYLLIDVIKFVAGAALLLYIFVLPVHRWTNALLLSIVDHITLVNVLCVLVLFLFIRLYYLNDLCAAARLDVQTAKLDTIINLATMAQPTVLDVLSVRELHTPHGGKLRIGNWEVLPHHNGNDLSFTYIHSGIQYGRRYMLKADNERADKYCSTHGKSWDVNRLNAVCMGAVVAVWIVEGSCVSRQSC